MRVIRFLFLGLVATGLIAAAAFLPWTAGREATEIPFRDLFGVTGDTAGFGASLALPLLAAAVLALLGTFAVSRWLLLVAGLVAVATTGGWIAQMALDDASDFTVDDLRLGVWLGAAGFLVALLAGFAARGRRAERRTAVAA
ncbi:MAG: hypothetical protein ACRD29_18570 [Acidimicrobiales bacterium]